VIDKLNCITPASSVLAICGIHYYITKRIRILSFIFAVFAWHRWDDGVLRIDDVCRSCHLYVKALYNQWRGTESTRSRNNEEEIQLLWFCDLGTLTEKHCSSRRLCANVIGNILSNYVTSIGFLSVIHPLAPVILVTVILHLSGQIRKKDRRLSCRLDDVNFVCTFLNCAVSYPG
jgi:hypothetical protein